MATFNNIQSLGWGNKRNEVVKKFGKVLATQKDVLGVSGHTYDGRNSSKSNEPSNTQEHLTGAVIDTGNKGYLLSGLSDPSKNDVIKTSNTLDGLTESFLGTDSAPIYENIVNIHGNEVDVDSLFDGYTIDVECTHVVMNTESIGTTTPKSCKKSSLSCDFIEGFADDDPNILVENTTELTESSGDYVNQVVEQTVRAGSNPEKFIRKTGATFPGTVTTTLIPWHESVTKTDFDVTFLMYVRKLYYLSKNLTSGTLDTKLEFKKKDNTKRIIIDFFDNLESFLTRKASYFSDNYDFSTFTLVVEEGKEEIYARLLKFLILDEVPFDVKSRGVKWYLPTLLKFKDINNIKKVNVIASNPVIFRTIYERLNYSDIFDRFFEKVMLLFDNLIPHRSACHSVDGLLLSLLTIFNTYKIEHEGRKFNPNIKMSKVSLPVIIGVFDITQPQTNGYISSNTNFKEFNALQITWYLKFKSVVFSCLDFIVSKGINDTKLNSQTNSSYIDIMRSNKQTLFTGVFSNDQIWKHVTGCGYNKTFAYFMPGLIPKYIKLMYGEDLSLHVESGKFYYVEPFPLAGFTGNTSLLYSSYSSYIGKTGIIEIEGMNGSGILTTQNNFNTISKLAVIEGHTDENSEETLDYGEIQMNCVIESSCDYYTYDREYTNLLVAQSYKMVSINVSISNCETDLFFDEAKRLDNLQQGISTVADYSPVGINVGEKEYLKHSLSQKSNLSSGVDAAINKIKNSDGITQAPKIASLLLDIDKILLKIDPNRSYGVSRVQRGIYIYVDTTADFKEILVYLNQFKNLTDNVMVTVGKMSNAEANASLSRSSIGGNLSEEDLTEDDPMGNQDKFSKYIRDGIKGRFDPREPINRPEKTVEDNPYYQKTVCTDLSTITTEVIMGNILTSGDKIFVKTGDGTCVEDVVMCCLKVQCAKKETHELALQKMANSKNYANGTKLIQLIRELEINVYFCYINSYGNLNKTLFKVGKKKTKDMIIIDEYNKHVSLVDRKVFYQVQRKIEAEYPHILENIKAPVEERIFTIFHTSYKHGIPLYRMSELFKTNHEL